ncbi:glutaryl 7-ACA acylase [Asticcacaulis biprosthecium C19]|uniref:Glutaryl 7-ACA acylase n=1 Tax=Asticcacaulis biprosthecium C19 TaxID=715226 RepID=F4QTH4_9CAUL|nr:CocE/NonD family hydrolase [Asticcacaulis biprosthecium]EGF90044.1 glutaryl 7-ACA acylase [Asticcacaulis biprosthecium C19]
MYRRKTFLTLLAGLAGLCVLVFTAFAAKADTASAADYVRQSLYVPVRDGTRLAVNIYRPAVDGQAMTAKHPVVFVFTPYRARFRNDKGEVVETALNDQLALQSLVRAGYVVAVADIRGKGASFGHRRGFQDRTEAYDGYDLVEWLARQTYTTGAVGMIGCSYYGGTTFHTASTAPPSLKAVFIGASDLDKYNFVRAGGITAQFNTRPDEPLSVDLASLPVDADPDGNLLRQAVAQHAQNTPMGPLWYGMPNRDSMSAYTGNAYWEEVGVYNYLDAIRKAGIATYFWSNWQDEPTAQTLLGAKNLGGKFLGGPGSHCVPPPGFDFTGEITRYFDHYLKGIDNGIEREPRATYWVEGLDGRGGYVRSDQLPGVRSQTLSWFLTGDRSGTAQSANDGGMAAKAAAAGKDTFTVDYDLPPPEYFAFWPQPMDKHGLSYTSPAMESPLTLIGSPVAHLAVTASHPEADIFVYLDQVAADGSAEVVAFGRLKISHRKLSPPPYDNFGLPWHSGRSADILPLAEGEVVQMSIALTPVSRVVPAGARLRLTVTGADPRQRNLKDIKLEPAPRITVLLGGAEASRLDLPHAQ